MATVRRLAAVLVALVFLAVPAPAQAKGNCVDLDSSNCWSTSSCKGKRCNEDHPQCTKGGASGTCSVVIQKKFNCCCVCQTTRGNLSSLSGIGASVLGALLLVVGSMVHRRPA